MATLSDTIRDLYFSGLSVRKVAKELGIRNSTVHEIMKHDNIPARPLSFNRKHYGCKVEDCDRKHFGKGYCNTHYQMMRRQDGFSSPKRCKLEDCNRPLHAKGYCHAHYMKWKVIQGATRHAPAEREVPAT